MTTTTSPNRALILIYNADSGIFNALADSAHKLLSPSTYDCQLCALTFGALQMKKEWAHFLRALAIPVEFLHRDEFHSKFSQLQIALPAVLIRSGGHIEVLIQSDAIKRCKTLKELEDLLQSRTYEATSYS